MNLNFKKDPLLPVAKVCFFLLLSLIITILAYREFGSQDGTEQESVVVAMRELHFYDTSDGKILITDKNGTEVSVVGSEGGFMRAVLRSLAMERIALGVGPEEPFKLTASKNGVVSIIDPITGRKIDVSSFGITNSEIFTTLLVVPNNVKEKVEG